MFSVISVCLFMGIPIWPLPVMPQVVHNLSYGNPPPSHPPGVFKLIQHLAWITSKRTVGIWLEWLLFHISFDRFKTTLLDWYSLFITVEINWIAFLSVHLHWAKANFFSEPCHCSTLNWILCEPIQKRCRCRFHSNLNEPKWEIHLNRECEL